MLSVLIGIDSAMTRPDTTLPLTGSQRQWLRHLRACEAEGQTTVAYAKAHGLKVGVKGDGDT